MTLMLSPFILEFSFCFLRSSTQYDEMCNFYVMYWVDGDKTMHENYCFTAGPPSWNWGRFPGLNSSDVPNTASIVPSTGEVLKATQKILQQGTATINQELAALRSYIASLQEAPEEPEADYQDGGEEQYAGNMNGVNVDIPAVKYWQDYNDDYNNEVMTGLQ